MAREYADEFLAGEAPGAEDAYPYHAGRLCRAAAITQPPNRFEALWQRRIALCFNSLES